MDGGGAIARWIELQSTTTLISPTGRVGYGRVDCAGMACGFFISNGSRSLCVLDGWIDRWVVGESGGIWESRLGISRATSSAVLGSVFCLFSSSGTRRFSPGNVFGLSTSGSWSGSFLLHV